MGEFSRMKRVLISGANGQLVTDIIKALSTPENDGFFNTFAFNRQELDVTHKEALSGVFSKYNPDFFIQGASYHVVEEINKNPKAPVIAIKKPMAAALPIALLILYPPKNLKIGTFITAPPKPNCPEIKPEIKPKIILGSMLKLGFAS